MLPLSVPALASFAIFQFLWVWNDLLVARVFLGILPQNQVLTAQMKSMLGTRGENLHLLPAAAFISIFVPLLVFFSLPALLRARLARRFGQRRLSQAIFISLPAHAESWAGSFIAWRRYARG